jgi:hypothetical protein
MGSLEEPLSFLALWAVMRGLPEFMRVLQFSCPRIRIGSGKTRAVDYCGYVNKSRIGAEYPGALSCRRRTFQWNHGEKSTGGKVSALNAFDTIPSIIILR